MSKPTRQHNELLTLLEQLCDSTLSDEEWLRLEDILLADAQARWIYRQYLDLHAGLQQYHQACRRPVVVPSGSPILDFLGNSVQQGLAFCWKATPWSIILAIVFPLICLMLLGTYLSLTATVEKGPIYIAQLSRATDCTWADGVTAPSAGESLAIGQRLTLNKGVAEIAMSNGTALLLEGPATLDLRSPKRIGLTTGTLTVKVSKEAIGFSVWTPNVVVVDFGTEFGIAVSPEQSEVHVFTGEVELRSNATGTDIKGRQRLRAGQGGRVGRGSREVVVFQLEKSPPIVEPLAPSSRCCFRNGEAGYTGTRDASICTARRGRGGYSVLGLGADRPNTLTCNFGHETELLTSWKPESDGLFSENSRTLIAFDDIFGDLPGQIPKGAVIVSATLRLHTCDSIKSRSDSENILHEVLVTWEEDTVTWGSFFGAANGVGTQYADVPVAEMLPDSTDTFFEMNVTDSLRRWASGTPNHGWILVAKGENRAIFDSSDAARVTYRPQLLVEYRVEEKHADQGPFAKIRKITE